MHLSLFLLYCPPKQSQCNIGNDICIYLHVQDADSVWHSATAPIAFCDSCNQFLLQILHTQSLIDLFEMFNWKRMPLLLLPLLSLSSSSPSPYVDLFFHSLLFQLNCIIYFQYLIFLGVSMHHALTHHCCCLHLLLK